MPTTDEASSFSKEAHPLKPTTDKKKEEPIATQRDHLQKTFMGKALTIKGNISSTEDILVDGHVTGVIAAKNSRLEIGVAAHVDANVYAKVIVINGRVKGDVRAIDQVVVGHTGQVDGNIYAADVSMEDGAYFKGSINMEKQEIAWEASLPDTHEDDHEKASSFGFLFRRTRAGHADVSIAPQVEISHKETDDEERAQEAIITAHQEWPKLDKSLIGKSVLIKGSLESEEDVEIWGEIDGNIYLKNNGLQVGVLAHVKGNIYVKELTAQGEVRGNIWANHVSIKKQSQIFGDIHSPRVSIESGGSFQGKVEMEQQNIEEAYAISNPSTKEKGNFLKQSLESNFEDVKNGLQGVVTQAKPKRVPWPE